MSEGAVFDHLFLGHGGPRPGLSVVGVGGAGVRRLVDMPTDHSVYAIDVDAVNGLVAVGTRAGSAELLSWQQAPAQLERRVMQSDAQGAPVLSVCLVDGSFLVSADITGRCLLWRLHEQSDNPVALETNGEQVCSAVWIPDERMVGLSANGKLLSWSVPDFQLLQITEGPRPSPKLALVRLRHWPDHNAVVYPAHNGQLVACELDSLELTANAAHEGAFYACIVDGDQLHTIGHADGVMRAWDGVDDSSPRCRVPHGIIAAVALNDGPARFLLVGDDGEAATYTTESGSLHRLVRLGGSHYRTTAGPSPQAREEHAKGLLTTRCEQLRSQFLEDLDADRMEELEDLHRELVNLGAEAVSLTLRVRQAVQQQDLIGELKARRQLATLMPDQPNASLASYTRLLETTWQLAEAARVRATPTSNDDAQCSTDWLGQAAAILDGRDWVVEADVPIPVLIEAATVLERPFVGRWVVTASEPVPFPGGGLTAEAMAAKYTQVRAEYQLQDLPGARVRPLWWVSDGAIEQTDTIVLTEPHGQDGPELCAAIQIVGDELRSAFVPWILFDARVEPTCRRPDHNLGVLRAYQAATQRGLHTVWPQQLHWAVSLTFRRLCNQVRSQRIARKERNV